MQEGVSELPAYEADDMTFVQEEEVFPVLPSVIPSLLRNDENDEDEVEDSKPGKKVDSKPGGKRKATDTEEPKKVLLSY